MTDRESLYQGLSHAAWGYFLITVDVNINSVSILPRFAGFLLLLAAISRLSAERRDLALLRPLCILLAVWSGADWLLSWFGGSVDGRILLLDLVVAAAALYFHFQFLTDMAALAEQYQPEGEQLDQRLRRRRTMYTLLWTASTLVGELSQTVEWELWPWLFGALAVAGFVVALMVMASLFQLRRCVRDFGENRADLQ